ncbi:NAD(P)/FAD-dependent oxidoreductase [Sphingomonas sp. LT1P40]|uniref:NAD(P)/FAD-dependent oxidoreductase n=1 Tax=Alteristakelama amylovorans TaxID=3096166 RepID=UPI002FCA1B58
MADPATLVVGGGIVGLACAVEAQRRGHAVTLIERDEPGRQCSFGNAGILAVSEIFPLITPDRLRMLPRMLLSRDAPAVIRVADASRVLPWMLRAATSLSRVRQDAIIAGLTALNGNAVTAWRNLLADCGAVDLLRERGMIRLVREQTDLAELVGIRDRLARYGFPARLLDHKALRELEPAIGQDVLGGLLHESDADVGDPLRVSQALCQYFSARGGTIVRETALTVLADGRGGTVVTDIASRTADQIWITAGMESGKLLAPLGAVVPLQAERGYHLMLSDSGERLNRPVTFQRESCVATPMGGMLRLAGTVEFAAQSASPDWSRADRLIRLASRYFDIPLSGEGASRWLGSRPSLPDSLPAIGRLKRAPAIGYAFGHQHLGVTQAAISAQLLAQCMGGEATVIPAAPYRIDRFG